MGLFHLIVLKHIEVLKHNKNAMVLLGLYASFLYIWKTILSIWKRVWKSEQGSRSQVSMKAMAAAVVRPVTATLEGWRQEEREVKALQFHRSLKPG